MASGPCEMSDQFYGSLWIGLQMFFVWVARIIMQSKRKSRKEPTWKIKA
jgi:hypothetical protein